jgi:hypothetical protein
MAKFKVMTGHSLHADIRIDGMSAVIYALIASILHNTMAYLY